MRYPYSIGDETLELTMMARKEKHIRRMIRCFIDWAVT